MFVQIWARNPKQVQMKTLPFLPAYGKRVFSAPMQTNVSEFALLKIQSKIAQIRVLPILTRQPNTH